jgi:beta-galactosidase
MKYEPMNPKLPRFLHGGDYNPDQWKDVPGIWDEDFRLMKLAQCNAMSIGIFSWTALEPEEGRFDFSWLDEIMDRLAAQGAFAVLATPSGARPAWLSQKYPEVLRVDGERRRQLHGERHNHCYTSPAYRARTQAVNRKLAERYKDHPALLLWHVSNEYGGECHCPLCQDAFRDWLKERYHGDLDALNQAWWTSFWSHTYTDWSQIESPSRIGERFVHAQNLDWMRFVTHQTIDFFKAESSPLRELTPNVPVTVNLMGTYPGFDPWKFAKELDVVSWDNYPTWHGERSDAELASDIAFVHDINRSLKGGKPFLLMESTPSMTNWQPVSKLKRPGMHLLSSLQAVAHGSDSVQYFQWRKSRGSSEKLHGAVVDHCGHEHTRVFRDVAEVGEALSKLDAVVGTSVRPDVALIYDWENEWALRDALGLNNRHKEYEATAKRYYEAFWKRGVPVDVVSSECGFDGYRLLVAPMLYMLKPGVAERIEAFVARGGTFVATYCSGFVDESDLCFLGGFPGPLRKVLGIWDEETDGLYDGDVGRVRVVSADAGVALGRTYDVRQLCDLVHAETAQVLAVYDADFYAGRPALTVNDFGKGKAYFVAFRNNADFESDFLGGLVSRMGLLRAIDADLPDGVTAQLRTDGTKDFAFVLNFAPEPRIVHTRDGKPLKDMLSGDLVADGVVALPGFGIRVFERAH